MDFLLGLIVGVVFAPFIGPPMAKAGAWVWEQLKQLGSKNESKKEKTDG